MITQLLNKAASLQTALGDVMTPRKAWSARIENSSFYRIPAVESFEIISGDQNPLLKGTGLDRKLPKKVIRKVHAENEQMNDYIAMRIRAMRKALKAGHPEMFWKMVRRDMKYSTAFRLSCFNTVCRGWYKDLDIGRVFQILYGVKLILERDLTELKYFRVDIPKGTPAEILKFHMENPNELWPGKTRPLGVPTAPWRVVLNMWNGFLTLFLEHEIKPFNHAFMPRVGTNTALKSFIVNVLPYSNIYEFDLKGFFPNVSIPKVLEMLKDRGMPVRTLRELFELLSSAPDNIDWNDKESMKNDYDKLLGKRKWTWELLIKGQPQEVKNKNSGLEFLQEESEVKKTKEAEAYEAEVYKRKFKPWKMAFDIDGAPAFYQPKKPSFKSEETTIKKWLLTGLPQGAAPSTILSLLVLVDWYKKLREKGIKLLMYADDGFLYSEKEFEPFSPDGIEFAKEKSRWVRKDNKNLVEVTKFLGVDYNYKTELISGHTKNGSRLEFGPKQLNLLNSIADISGYSDLMTALTKSGIWGLALSKLYGGKFGKPDGTPKAEYNPNSYWGYYHDIECLSKDQILQRTASTIACDWLSRKLECSKNKKGIRWSKAEIRRWHASKRLKIQLEDLKTAAQLEEIWEAKNRQ